MKTMVDTRFYRHLGPLFLGDLLSGLDIDLVDDQFADIQINNAAPADQAGVADICYFEGGRTATKLENCGASACFVREADAQSIAALGCLPLITKFPRADFARVLDRLYAFRGYEETQSFERSDITVSAGVVIGKGAEIGANTSIGPNSVIGPGVRLGKNCKIGANVVIECATIGDSCIVHNGAVIGGSGFGVAVSDTGGVDMPHVGAVTFGDFVSVGCQTTIDRALFGNTVIGSGCKFDNLVHIAHNTHIGPNCMFAAFVGIAGSCDIGAGVIMGGKAGVSDHITIGDGVTLSAAAMTMHNIPAGEKWGGVPAGPMREYMRQVSAIRKLVRKKKKPE